MDGVVVNLDCMINLVKERPALWDKTAEDYKSRHLKTSAWHEIFGILIENFSSLPVRERHRKGKLLIKKWTSEREKYIKWRRRHIDEEEPGIGASLVKRPPYFDRMHFLDKIIGSFKRRSSSLDSSEAEDEPQDTKPILSPDPFVIVVNSPIHRPDTPVQPTKKKPPLDEFEDEIIIPVKTASLAPLTSTASEHPLLSFFRSTIPALEEFSVDEHLQFQIQVLSLIQRMKKEKARNLIV